MWWAVAAAWGACTAPTHNADVADAVGLAMERYAAFDTTGFEAAATQAEAAAGCLVDV